MEAMQSKNGAYKTSASGWEVGNEGNTEDHGTPKGSAACYAGQTWSATKRTSTCCKTDPGKRVS